MGLFRSKKKKEEQARSERQEKEAQKRREEVNALEQKLFGSERVLLCGRSSFTNMMFQSSHVNRAQEVETLLCDGENPDAVFAACRAFQPTLLIFTTDLPEVIALAAGVAKVCPQVVIVVSTSPEVAGCKGEELAAAHIRGVLPRPCDRWDFLDVMREVKGV